MQSKLWVCQKDWCKMASERGYARTRSLAIEEIGHLQPPENLVGNRNQTRLELVPVRQSDSEDPSVGYGHRLRPWRNLDATKA